MKQLTNKLHEAARRIVGVDGPEICAWLAVAGAPLLGPQWTWCTGTLTCNTGGGSFVLGKDVDRIDFSAGGTLTGDLHFWCVSSEGWVCDFASRLYPTYSVLSGVDWRRDAIDPLYMRAPMIPWWIKLAPDWGASSALHRRIKGTTFERTCRQITEAAS